MNGGIRCIYFWMQQLKLCPERILFHHEVQFATALTPPFMKTFLDIIPSLNSLTLDVYSSLT